MHTHISDYVGKLGDVILKFETQFERDSFHDSGRFRWTRVRFHEDFIARYHKLKIMLG